MEGVFEKDSPAWDILTGLCDKKRIPILIAVVLVQS